MSKQISGIYTIVNKLNNKRYVGSSKAVNYRWKQGHLPQLKAGNHHNRHLQSAWRKYGEDQFAFEILEECEEEKLLEREGFWIEHYRSWEREYGYNLIRIVDNEQVLSKETIDKRTITRQNSNYWTTGVNTDILRLFGEGVSKNKIAIQLGITRSAVYSCLEQNGLHKNTGRGAEVKLTDEIKDRIDGLRKERKSWNDILDIVGISKTQAYRSGVAGEDGLYCGNKRDSYRTVTAEIIQKVEKLRKEGRTWEQIETEVGVSRFALHLNGITARFKLPRKGHTGKRLSEDKVQEIIKLHHEGVPKTRIAKKLSIPASTVRAHIKRNNENQEIQTQQRIHPDGRDVGP